MGYYYGVRDPMIFKKQDEDTLQIASDHNMTRKSGHKLYHWQGILNTNGRFISGSIMCGALINNNMEGIIICQNGKTELIKAEILRRVKNLASCRGEYLCELVRT